MGRSIFALGKITDAENTWRMSIQIASEVKGTSQVLESILGIANVRARQGNSEQAYELLLVVLNHPATVQQTSERAAKLSAELEAQLPPSQIEAIRSYAGGKTLEVVVEEALK